MPAVTGPVQEAQGGATNLTFGGSFTVTFPSNVAAGDSVLIAIACGAVATEFDPTPSGLGGTWTRLQQLSNPTTGVLDLWLCTGANGSTKIITVTVGSGTTEDVAAIASEWGALEAAGVSNGTLHGSAGSSPTTTATVSVTPDTGRRYQLVVAYAMTDDSASAGPTINNSPTTFTSFTGRTQDTVRIAGGYIKLNPPSGSYGTTWNIPTVGQHYNAITVAVYAAPLAAVNGAGTITAADSSVGANGANVVPDNPLPLELRVYAGDDLLGDAIAILSGKRGFSWRDEYNALGSGQFELAATDAAATTTILEKYNLVRCYLGAFDVFQFWIEALAWDLASPDGDAGNKVTVSGRGLEAYLNRGRMPLTRSYTTETVGAILLDNTPPNMGLSTMPVLSTDFSETVDSAGAAWSGDLAAVTISFNPGTSLLDVVNQLRQAGAYVQLRNDFVLQAWNSDPGRIRTSTVVIREGKHLAGPIRWEQPEANACSTIWVRDSAGDTTSVIVGGTGLPENIVGFMSVPYDTDADTRTAIGTAEIARRLAAQTAIRAPVHHGLNAGEYEPYRHYNKGDFVGFDVAGFFSSASEQVAAIEVVGADAGYYALTLDLAATPPNPLVNLAKQVAALSTP